jgi:DNA primase
MIEKEKIEEIKRQTDIVSLIAQYIPLKKVGKNYRALCPFHTEKAPSFYVNPEKGIFYCFGCKKGGNAINFLMEYEKMDFPSAIRTLAKNLGIEIETTRGLKYKEIYEANEIACQFFSICLTKDLGKRGQNYLLGRHIKADALKDFRLGYAPVSGGLITFARQKGIAKETLEKAGLISQAASGARKYKEIFRDRLIFPIFNLSGRIIGYGGRSIDDQHMPKYLNSRETPIFKKGDILYGLYQARKSIRSENEAILVEGYFDLLSLVQQGVDNICAPLGTSLTEQQSVLIARSAKKVNILFDGDLSGMKAALRAIGLLINAQVDVYVTQLPEDFDPDRFINENGVDALKQLIGSATDFFHFYKKMSKPKTVEQEVVLIKDLIEIIGNINDPIRFDRYLKHAARVFDIPVETIQKAMGRSEAKTSTNKRIKISGEQWLIALIMGLREHFSDVKKILSPDDFKDPGVRRLYDQLLKDEAIGIDEALSSVTEELRQNVYSVLMRDETVTKEILMDSLLRHKSRIEEQKIRTKISEAMAKGDDTALTKYQEEHKALKQKILRIGLDAAQPDQDI